MNDFSNKKRGHRKNRRPHLECSSPPTHGRRLLLVPPPSSPPPLPASVLLLLRSSDRSILYQLSQPLLFFYKDILKSFYCQMQRLADYHFQQRESPIRQHQRQRAAPHAHTQMQKSILFLLREIVTAQRLRIASTTIQQVKFIFNYFSLKIISKINISNSFIRFNVIRITRHYN